MAQNLAGIIGPYLLSRSNQRPGSIQSGSALANSPGPLRLIPAVDMSTSRITVAIDDASPQIQYYTPPGGSGSGWTTDFPEPFKDQFYGKSRHVTSSVNDYLSLVFRGSSVRAVGPYNANHGDYRVELDGKSVGIHSGFADPGPKMSQLGELQDNLNVPRDHTLVITNLGDPKNASNSWFAIDYIEITQAVSGQIYTHAADDTDTSFQFSEGWNAAKIDGLGWFGGTSHGTSDVDASATFSFKGTSVQLFGRVAPTCGNYSISIDGGPELVLRAHDNNNTYERVSLYATLGLAEGDHKLVVRNKPTSEGKELVIDYAVCNATNAATSKPVSSDPASSISIIPSSRESSSSWNPSSISHLVLESSGRPNLSSPNTGPTASPGDAANDPNVLSSEHRSGIKSAAIIVPTVVLSIAFLAVMAGYLLWRRKMRRRREEEGEQMQEPVRRTFISNWRRNRDTFGRL